MEVSLDAKKSWPKVKTSARSVVNLLLIELWSGKTHLFDASAIYEAAEGCQVILEYYW